MGKSARDRHSVLRCMELWTFLSQNPVSLLERWTQQTPWGGKSLSSKIAAPAPTRMISVIIPAHNEADYLGPTLRSIQAQNYGWYEVIVVANGCRDGTAAVARGQCHRLVVLPQRNLGLARNLGARLARGEILLFLDADTTLESCALRRIVEEFTPVDAAGTLKGRPDRPRWAYRMIYALKNLVHCARLHPGSSGAILCWKKYFVLAGGFDEGLQVRENSELLRRLRRFGRYKYLGGVAATTSMRRYEQRGFWRVVWLWIKLWFESLVRDLHQRPYEVVR